MAKYNSNIEIAQEISARLGDSPIPFESIYSIALQIYNELGGEPTQFDNVYSILLNTLPLVEGGIASKVIDDHLIATDKTWSSDKINSELSSKQDTLIAGDNVTISDNTISVTIPNVIDDSTTSNNKTWSSNKVAAELANAGFSVQIVQELPVSGDTHTIYFVPETGGETGDAYDEYMYIDNTWEKIGSTRIDLSEYAKKLDYFIPLNMQTQEIDWTVLNSAVNGVYRVAIGIEMAGQRMIMQQGVMTNVLTGNKRTQTIVVTPLEPSAQGSPLQVHYRVTNKAGTQWYDYDYNLGIINDGVLSSPSTATDKVYSRAKVDDLLNNKQNTLTAGEGIEISSDTISVTPTDNATNDDIDSMFVKEIKLIREQTNYENYIDWLVNTNGETMEYNGQTYYKWVSWANDVNNNGSWTLTEYPNIIVLTNTLDVQLPFNTNSPEFEYWISIYNEEISEHNYVHGDYTKKMFQ